MSGTSPGDTEPLDRQQFDIDPPPTDGGRWFAYELHDGLLQWVIGARMHAQAALAAAAEVDSIPIDKHRACIAGIKVMLDQATEEGRSLIRFVDEVSDGPVDIYQQLDQFRNSELSRHLGPKAPSVQLARSQPPWPSLPTRRAWSVLRILQQAIQNAAAHSQAERIEVHLGWEDKQTLLATVSDNGVGFDSSAQFPNHFGLRTMKHRAAMCRGKLEITSAPGRGCQVRLTVSSVLPVPPC